jgi:hypothetical protein
MGAMLKGWQERYFGITTHYLNYYEGREKTEVKGSVDLAGVTDVLSDDVMIILEEAGLGLTHKLKAESEDEASLWAAKLKEAIVGFGAKAGHRSSPTIHDRAQKLADKVRYKRPASTRHTIFAKTMLFLLFHRRIMRCIAWKVTLMITCIAWKRTLDISCMI